MPGGTILNSEVEIQPLNLRRETQSRGGYLPTLDGWRAVAILMVMIYHGTVSLFVKDGLYPNLKLQQLVGYGTWGVPIFFAISGFLISTRLLHEEREKGRINLSAFYVRRSCRILPPYLTYLGVLGVIAATGVISVQRIEWLSSVLFFRNYVTPLHFGIYTSHFWSLAIEEHFYLLWPTLLVLCGARRARWAVVVLALGVAGWRSFEFRHHWLVHLLPGAGFSQRTDIRIDGLLWGCWVALLYMIPDYRGLLTRWLTPWRWLTIVAVFIACMLSRLPLTALWLSLLLPFILLGTVMHPSAFVGRVLESSLLRWIGRLSYSLYIWQQLFLISNDGIHSYPLGALQRIPFNYFVVFCCAVLSYYLIERPAIRLGHRLTHSQGAAASLYDAKLSGA
jgi:peptidoglycan/LPS O-acetylase OafA/YrhL